MDAERREQIQRLVNEIKIVSLPMLNDLHNLAESAGADGLSKRIMFFALDINKSRHVLEDLLDPERPGSKARIRRVP